MGIGGAFTQAGPLSVLLGYTFTGVAVFAMMQCLGEMATWLPLPGSIPQFCARYVDDALGFAVGWNVSSSFLSSSRALCHCPMLLSQGQIFYRQKRNLLTLTLIELVCLCHHSLRRNFCRVHRHPILARCPAHQRCGLDQSYHRSRRLLKHLRHPNLWRSRIHFRFR